MAAIFWMVLVFGYHISIAMIYKKAVSQLEDYWPLEWTMIIFFSLVLAAVSISWSSISVNPSVSDTPKTKLTGWKAFLAWLREFMAFARQDSMVQISIGLFISYGLFLITELFDLAEIKPHFAIVDGDKTNLVRLAFGNNLAHHPALYFLLIFLTFLFVVLIPVLRSLEVNKASKNADVTAILRGIESGILWETDHVIQASKEDCAKIDDAIRTDENALATLKDEELSVERKITAAKSALCLYQSSMNAADLQLQDAKAAPEATGVKTETLDYFATAIPKSIKLANDWTPFIPANFRDDTSLADRCTFIKGRLTVLETRLAQIRPEIAKLEERLEMLRSLLKHCNLREDLHVKLPVYGIAFRYEYAGALAAGLAFVTLCFLGLNALLVSPGISSKAEVFDGMHAWFWFATFLTAVSGLPIVVMLRFLKLAISGDNDMAPTSGSKARGWGLLALSVATFLVAIGFILPGTPTPKIVESIAPTRVDVTCTTAPLPSPDAHGIFRFWYLAKNSIIGARTNETFEACQPAQEFEKTNYIVAVGVASQEGKDETKENQLAADRAYKLMAKLEPTPAAWGGHKFLLVYGQAKNDPALMVPPYSNDHSETDPQRPTILLGGYLAPPVPAPHKDTLKDRYVLALEHLNLLFFGKPPVVIQPNFKAQGFRDGLDGAAVAAGVDKAKYKLDCLYEVTSVMKDNKRQAVFTLVGTKNSNVCPVPTVN